MPGTFEWWYFQGKLDDNSTEQITLLVKPWFDNNGPLQPYANIAITTPNGTHLFGGSSEEECEGKEKEEEKLADVST